MLGKVLLSSAQSRSRKLSGLGALLQKHKKIITLDAQKMKQKV